MNQIATQRTVLDLFSAAAGGWSLGMHRAGYRTLAACENVAWRRALYQENNPHVRIYDDVCTLTSDRLIRDLGWLPDIIVGSPPCQDISPANTKGKGVEGERSGLYFEAIRIIGECRPRWFALENSANLRTRGADAVLSALEALGYACWSFVVRAGDIGANHERPRSWVIGCDISQVSHANHDGQFPSPFHEQVGELYSMEDRLIDTKSLRHESWRPWGHGSNGHGSTSVAEGNDANAAQERPQGLSWGDEQRQDEISERADISPRSKMGLCETDRIAAFERRADWSLNDLADHLRLDARLSTWVADTRIAVGGPRGTSAASLIVEAFGDAVVPQIPEAIGKAILRTEAALAAIYGKAAS